MSSVLIPVVAVLTLLVTPASAQPAARGKARPTQVAQQARGGSTATPEQTQKASDRLTLSQKQQKRIEAQMGQLRNVYNEQLAEVDRLKRSRASWRRDRQLREQKARSQKTAVALQDLERSLRNQRTIVSRDRKGLARAIDQELSAGAPSARQSSLRTMLRGLRANLRKAPKKISMPDLELDEFADPEELLEQIALIERAESKLIAEESSLQRRADHYDHMDILRSKRLRADDIGVFDDEGVRRLTGRVGSGSDGRTTGVESNDDADHSGQPAPADPGGSTDLDASKESGTAPGSLGGDFATSSIVLADVVDASTQDALRRAQRSNSPRIKAEVAKQAKKQVRDRLSRLRAGKARIQRHLQRLKN